MRKLLEILFLLIIWYSVFFGVSFAKTWVWGIDDINIISRSERWADEALRYWNNTEYKKFIDQKDQYDKYMDELKENDLWKYVDEKKKQSVTIWRNNYLEENFIDEITIDSVIDKYLDYNLRWSQSYHFNKNRIIVHHTASEYHSEDSPEDVRISLRNIYRYHAITRWWWDVWYNFIIDQFWNIYEWRAWWDWVVWAHAKRNNVSSIWISLIWNFQYQIPTDQQFEALVNLTTALSKKYNINPNELVSYHKEISTEPYIVDTENYSIAWHRDAWHTSCPWENLYKRLDELRKAVTDGLKWIKYVSSNYSDMNITKKKAEKTTTMLTSKNDQEFTIKSKDSWKKINSYTVNKKFVINGNQDTIIFKHRLNDMIKSCYTKNSTFSVESCDYKDWKLSFILKYNLTNSTLTQKVYVEWEKANYIFNLNLTWQKDIDMSLENKKQAYITEKWFKLATIFSEKVKYKVTLNDAKKSLKSKVRVLLYELSVDFSKWIMRCEKWCTVKVDWISLWEKKDIIVEENSEWINISLDWTDMKWYKILISNKDEISVMNYDRKSYAGIPWNVFRWNIEIRKDKIKPIWQSVVSEYVVINELDFNDYLNWIAEMNDQQHIEKIKAMSLIIKDYILFYMSKKNIHPSIPENSSYNAVDDARIFQKYVWSWNERTVKRWFTALNLTRDQIILYDGYIPILPYFNCSAWFTWTGKEKYWWTDTPYLSSKLDFVTCKDFNWHGVWLSGQWADFMAQRWMKYKDIIKYYYDMDVSDM